LRGEVAYKPTASVAGLLWDAWKDLGHHDRLAFMVEPANLREPSWVLSYMPKADIEPGVPHPGRVQKRCPSAFAGRGLRAAYWGVIGRKNPPETSSIPFADAIDSMGIQFGGSKEAAA
ncbi:MAG: hypothetical protein NTV51_10295, partial [Verrucomicrobia bacterium]|nr:hypothetical protein [Verrucomicrobiota bacterium]